MPMNCKKEEAARQTKAKILRTAMKLMAARGIDAVSMNEIVKASGQRNASALNYHFENKAGLLQAIFDKHRSGIEQRRQKLLNVFGPTPSLEETAKVLLLPLIGELDNKDDGRAYLRILALMDGHQMNPVESEDQRSYSSLSDLSALLSNSLEGVPETEKTIRYRTIRNLVVTNLADYCALIQESPENDKRYRDTFISVMIETVVSILSAEKK